MASVNKVLLIGNLGRDPETRYTQGGDAICNITIATTESWKDKASGERKEATEWHRVVMFGQLAEIASQYLKKGSQVYIEGKLTTRKWQDKDGQDRYTTEIRADVMKMLGGKPEGEAPARKERKPESTPAGKGSARQAPSAPAPGGLDFDDDIPF